MMVALMLWTALTALPMTRSLSMIQPRLGRTRVVNPNFDAHRGGEADFLFTMTLTLSKRSKRRVRAKAQVTTLSKHIQLNTTG
jgi:hypothetical protein